MHGPGDVRFFDRFASVYDRLMPPADADALEAGLRRSRRSVERVLDVGGGTGRATRALDVPERVVVDASGGMLRRARKRGLDCVRADAGRLPFVDDAVDAVTVVDALHHLPNPRAAVGEAARVLAPGGVLVIREFDPSTLRGRALVASEKLVGFDSAFATPAELVRFLERAGFRARIVETGFGYTVAGVVEAAGADEGRSRDD